MKELCIQCGTKGKKIRTLQIKYGKFKYILLSIYQNGFLLKIKLNRVNKQNIENRINSQIYIELLKKAHLIYFLINKRILNKNTLLISSDNFNQIFFKKFYFSIYVLNNDIEEFIDLESIVKIICNYSRSKYPKSLVCFEYLIAGDNCEFEYEKFRNYYSGFNAWMNNICENENISASLDRRKIEFLAKYLYNDFNFKLKSKKEIKIYNKLNLKYGETDISAKVLNLHQANFINFTCLDTLCNLEFPYYVRNNVFHGEAGVPLICAENDSEICNLKYCNYIIRKLLLDRLNDTLRTVNV